MAKDGRNKIELIRDVAGLESSVLGASFSYERAPIARSILAVAATTASFLPVTAEAGVQFKSYQTHSHVTVAVDPEMNYSVEPIKNGDTVTGLKLTLTQVKDDLEDLSAQSDPRTDKVIVTKTQTSNGKTISYFFQLSEKARKAGIEYFDFRSKAPSEVALDYWLKSQPTKPQVSKSKLELKTTAKVHPHRHHDKKAATESFAGCGQPLNQATEGYVHFKVAHRPFDYHSFFNMTIPDKGYVYQKSTPTKAEELEHKLKIKKGSKEAKEAEKEAKELAHYRLTLKLYQDEKYALVLRTMEFFNSLYPKSAFQSELRFLKANTFVQLAKMLHAERYMAQAMEIFRAIVNEESNTARSRSALAFIVQDLMDKRTPVLALEYALMGAELKPESFADPLTPVVYRLLAAESLQAIGEQDRAEKNYQEIIDQMNRFSPEAAFRVGELMNTRNYWERAIIAYEQAIRKFPNDAHRFPTAFFNLGESYFRIENYELAEKAFRDFEKRFPSDELTWAARMRIAELEQMKIKTSDPKKHEAIVDAYESIVNRHPYSPGALLSELRLSRCYKGLGPNDKTRVFFYDFFADRELKKAEDALLDPHEVEQWMDLAEARFFLNNGDPRSALKRADEYRTKMGRSALFESLSKIYSQAAVDLVIELGKFENTKELLAVSEHYGDLVFKPEPARYLLTLANARLSVGDLKDTAERTVKLESRLGELNDDDKDLYHLIKARLKRALGEKIDQTISDLVQMRDVGKYAAIKLDELAQSTSDKRDYRASLAYDYRLLENKEILSLINNEEKILAAEVRRVESTEALGDHPEAAKLADRALMRFAPENKYPQLLARLRDLRALANYDSGNFKGAVEGFDEILGNLPNHPRHSEFEFKRGMGLAHLGRDNEALETFKKLAKAAGNDVWKKSAQAELDQLQWESSVSNIMKEKDRRSSQ